MKCKLTSSGSGKGAFLPVMVFGAVLLAAVGLWPRPLAGADATPGLNGIGHEHGTNLAIYAEWRTNRLRLHYYVAANKTYVLQYLSLANTNNRGATFTGAPWVNLPGQQALRLPAPFDWEMSDFSVTNRNPTNLGRIYRLKVS